MQRFKNREESEFKEKLVAVNRVSKTVKGGRNMRFSALVVIGDEKGRVGYGMGKAVEIPEAIRKAVEDAKKHLIQVSLVGHTIPHEVIGKFGAGRTGTLASGAQSNHILTGWALGTGLGLSSWTSAIGTSFSRTNNSVVYATPVFSGFSVHAMYSNGLATDTDKWSDNSHYYGLGVKYQANAIRSSLIFEAVDNKATGTDAVKVSDLFTENEFKALGIGDDWAANKDTVIKEATGKKKAIYTINYGLEYNLGSWTPMFAYQFAHQNSGRRTHMFGLSAKVAVGGGDVLVGGRYLFGKDEAKDVGANKVAVDGDVRAWNIGAAYIYPLSKRTALKAYAGYADSGKEWKDVENVAYNGYQVYLGMRHSF